MLPGELNSIELVRILEAGEIAAMRDFLDSAPKNLKNAAGIEYT